METVCRQGRKLLLTVPHFCQKLGELGKRADSYVLWRQHSMNNCQIMSQQRGQQGKWLKMQSTWSARWGVHTAKGVGTQRRQSPYPVVGEGPREPGPAFPWKVAGVTQRAQERNQKLFISYSPTTLGIRIWFLQKCFSWAYVCLELFYSLLQIHLYQAVALPWIRCTVLSKALNCQALVPTPWSSRHKADTQTKKNALHSVPKSMRCWPCILDHSLERKSSLQSSPTKASDGGTTSPCCDSCIWDFKSPPPQLATHHIPRPLQNL